MRRRGYANMGTRTWARLTWGRRRGVADGGGARGGDGSGDGSGVEEG